MSDYLRISAVSLDREPGDLFALLSTQERARAGRFHHERDRRRFVVARARLRSLLGEHLGVDPHNVVIDVAPGGKPVLGVNPSAAPVHFNVSHCAELALIAISSSEIGIDVERVTPSADMDRVAAHFFTGGEVAAFQQLETKDKADFFFRTWVRKEAYLKATGRGFAIDPATATFDDRFIIRDLPDMEDHVAAIAVALARRYQRNELADTGVSSQPVIRSGAEIVREPEIVIVDC